MQKTEKSTGRFKRKVAWEWVIAILSLMLLIGYSVITGNRWLVSD